MAEKRDRINTRSRTYDDIVDDIRESLPILAPNWTSHGEDEPGMAILDILAGVADMLALYQDKQNRENFLTTAVLPESVHELANMLHYRPKRWVAAEGQLIVNVEASAFRETIVVPALQQITLKNNRKAIMLEELTIPGTFSGQLTVPIIEGEYKTFETEITPDNIFAVPLPSENIGEQLFEVFVENELWYDATDHPLNTNIDNFYYVRKTSDDLYKLSFRASRGRVPSYGDSLEVRYIRTLGVNIPADTIDASQSPSPNSAFTWSYTDLTNASLPETLEEIADRAPAKNATSDRAVTLEDYQELAQQLPNVKSIFVSRDKRGWNTVEIYVATRDGDAATIEQLTLVREFFEKRNNIIVAVRTLPANIKNFNLTVSLRVRAGFQAARILANVRTKLQEELSYSNLDFASAIRISDVYAIVESVEGVDYSTIKELYWTGSNSSAQTLIAIENEHPRLYNLSVVLE